MHQNYHKQKGTKKPESFGDTTSSSESEFIYSCSNNIDSFLPGVDFIDNFFVLYLYMVSSFLKWLEKSDRRGSTLQGFSTKDLSQILV